MKVIGITGGIGCGKSTITKLLEDHFQAFLINTDNIAHMLMQKGMISYQLIVDYFGEAVLDQNKEIDRGLLGRIVYEDSDKLTILNSFTHPYVMNTVAKLIQSKREEQIELICVETALPMEAGLKDLCDEVWYIYASQEVRRARLKNERNYTDQKIDSILDKQITDEAYRSISTHVINNNGTMEGILKQIEVLLEK